MDDFEPVRALARLMEPFPHPWFVSGGWAIDLFLNRVTRSHSDLEIGLFREHQHALRERFSGWRLTKAEEEAWVPWPEDDWVAPPLFQVQAWAQDARDEPTYDFFLNDLQDGAWVFRRLPTITLPIAAIAMRTPDGIPFLRPDIQLAFKGKYVRPKDEQDFTLALPMLSAEQRAWLAMALRAAYGDHAWLARLDVAQPMARH